MNPIQGEILFKLFQQVNERIWYYDTATDRICYVASDGSTEETVPFKEHMAMKHPDDCPQVYESMDYMVKNHKPYPEPLMIRYKDENQPDGYRYTLNSIVPVWNGDEIRIVGSEQDITPMVRKQQLAEKQTQLIETLLLSGNGDTWTIDRLSDTISLKMKWGEVKDLPISELIKSFVLDECVGAAEAMQAIRRGEPKILEFTLLERRPDRPMRYMKCTAMPSKYDYLGNVVEYKGVSTDVTSEVTDKKQLTKALAEAEEQSRKKSVFVARASHDLRNPLNVLLSLSEMMCMDENMPLEERQELSDMMKQSGEALLTLINDILDLTRIESGAMQFTNEEFDIKQMVETAIQSFDISTGKSHNIMLEADVQKEVVSSDSKRMTQIVDNYLSNAIKYSPEGSDIRVTLSSSDADGIYIAVKDSGCGISDDDKHRVFDEFARFNTEVTGTGLGLSICKRIAEGLGGHVGFESQFGQGSTFWVKI